MYGIVDNKKIDSFIESDIFYKKAFKIAEGNAPEQTQNATIKYFFPRHRLKAGTIREDGTMDFRERGDIPQVEKGTVLAVKKSAVEGKVGKNIYNDTVRVKPARDIRLKAGKGTVLSEDRLKITAAVSGHPKLARDGTIFVYESFVVQGDVDYETGNIDYQGDVIIRGCIQNGFKVKGNNIKAQSIDGATVLAEGNVTIDQGINEANISARGMLNAKFIQNSDITCLGDVTTERELVESKINSNGICTIKGVVINSKIAAKMGVYARQIGMEKAPASTVRVGIDTFAEKDLEIIGETLAKKENEQNQLREIIAESHGNIYTAEAKIMRVSETKEQHDDERMDLLSKISAIDGNANEGKNKQAQMQAALKRLIKTGEEINQTITLCRDSIREMKQKISESEQMMEKNSREITRLLDERHNLIKWLENNPGFSIVKVEGKLMAGTRVYGRYCDKTIENSISAAVIKEEQINRTVRENEPGVWKLYITRI
ncbi:hypothetical protein MTBBW1_410025 [Desulfamplus magnetovallimortis]|uniref:Flagellar Assembly Protein A N-terminal region domain-containing protein n=1 Tax=Desulfamplus magnetovallimortis TaxID=1246637 RepID=A0A1W1HGT1_9BACT|nr:hypothetical protein MTBBW1_410025 [Desulfamplus magnetovallimortis]